MTGEALDCGGTGSARTSAAASGEGETSVVMGAVEEARDVEAVGEVGEGSFFANDFFSFARLFWNHTFSPDGRSEWNDSFFSGPEEDGELRARTCTSLGDILSFLASSLRLGALGFLSVIKTPSSISNCAGVVRLRVLMVFGTYV